MQTKFILISYPSIFAFNAFSFEILFQPSFNFFPVSQHLEIVFFVFISRIVAFDAAIEIVSILLLDETHNSSNVFIYSLLPVIAEIGYPFPIPFPKQIKSPSRLKYFCPPPISNLNPVTTSSKIRTALFASAIFLTFLRKLSSGFENIVGSRTIAAISFLFSSKILSNPS